MTVSVSNSVSSTAASAPARIRVGNFAELTPAGDSDVLENGNVTLRICPGVVTAPTRVSVLPLFDTPVGTRFVGGTAYEIGTARELVNYPSVLPLTVPVTVSIAYVPTSIPAGIAEDQLCLYRLAGTAWDAVSGSTVDVAAHAVSAPISRGGTYVVAANP